MDFEGNETHNGAIETAPLPIPSTAQEVEMVRGWTTKESRVRANDLKLVKRFYGPNEPYDFARIDAALKTAQKSAGAFHLADVLLTSSDPNVRFFGALTFMVKINKDWYVSRRSCSAKCVTQNDRGTLDPLDAEEVLNRLLDHLASAVTAGERSLMIIKICSALVAIFRRDSDRWTLCVSHVVRSISAGRKSPYPVDGDTSPEQIDTLNGPQILAVVWFATTLLEEISKADSNLIEKYDHRPLKLSR